MNKVYKIVWNATLNSWVVVSELGKSKKKSARTALVATSVALLTFSSSINAEVNTGGGTGSGTAISGTTANCGTQANSGSNTNNIAIGCASTTAGSSRSVAIGDNSSTASSGNSQSVAIGSVAVARGDQSVALGNNVNANGNSSIAIGGDDIDKVRSSSNSVYKTITGIDLPSGYPETTATGGGAVVVGVAAKAVGVFSSAFGMAANAVGDASVALGTTANAGGQGALAIGAVSSASNSGSVAIGINSLSSGVNSTAIGSGSSSGAGAEATGAGATAIGANTSAAANATALGINSTASQAGGVAIGSDSNASTASGVAGYDPITGTGSTTNTGVWKSTNAAVAVGNGSTVTRQINGLAAGTADTDAVNIAQLKLTKTYTDNVAKSTASALGGGSALNTSDGTVSAPTYTISRVDGTTTTANNVGTALSALSTDIIKPITFSADTGTNVARKLGQTISIKGGVTDSSKLTSNNIGVVSNGSDGLTVQLAKAVDLGSDGSVKAGNSTLNNTGLTISGGPSVTTTGINAANMKVTNVADGTISATSKDAINGSQLNTVATNLTNSGFNITANGANSDNVKLGETVNFTNTDGNLVASNSDNQVVYNLANKVTVGSGTGSKPVVIDGTAGTVTGLTNTTWNGTATTGRAATEDQLKSASDSLSSTLTSKGLSFAADSGSNVARKLGDTLSIKGGVTDSSKLTSNNIGVVSNGTDGLTVQLAKAVDLGSDGSVKAGNSTINNDGLTISGGPSVTTTGINAANMKVTNVADGTISATSKDAINGSQLNTVATNLTNSGFNITANGANSDNVKLGETVNFTNTDGNLVASNSDNQVVYNLAKNINLDSVTTGNTVLNTNGLTVKDAAGNTAVYGPVRTTITDTNGNKSISNATGTTFSDGLSATQITLDGLTISGGPSVTTTGVNAADMKITNVADGTISATSKDAINGSQLNTVATNLTNSGFNITANGANSDNVKLGETVNFTNTDGNLVASNSDNQVVYNLANKVTVGSGTGSKPVVIDGTAGTVTGLTNTNWDGTATTGRAATEDQLKTASDNVSNSLTNAGLSFAADSGNNVARKLGETLSIKGGVTDTGKLTNGNIGVVSNGTDGLTVQLAKAVDLGSDGSVKAGNSTINNDGLTISGGPSVTKDGVNAAGTTISNVKDGVNASDATTKGQLDAVSNSLTNAGLNFAANSGDTVSKKLGETLTIKGTGSKADSEYSTANVKTSTDSAGNLLVGIDKNASFDSVTAGNTVLNNAGVTTTDAAGNVASLTGSGTSITSKDGNTTANYGLDGTNLKDSAGNTTNTTAAGNTIKDSAGNSTNTTAAGNTVTAVDSNGNTTAQTNYGANGFSIKDGPSVTKDGVNAAGTTISNVKDGVNASDATTKGQLDAVSNSLTNAGLNFAANSGDTVSKKLGETLTIKGTGSKADSEYSTANVKTSTDSAGNLLVGIDKNASFDSVTAGNTSIGNTGLTILNGPSITTSGINAAGTKVTNVADATDAQDAVNKSQLDAVIKNNITNVTDGAGNSVNIADQVVNHSVNNSNTESLFLTYDKNGQETTDRLSIAQTVQKMNTEGVKYSHTNGDSTKGSLGSTDDSSAGGVASTAMGVNAIVADGANSTIALGHNTLANSTATNSVVIGNGSNVSGASSVAIGDGATASGTQSISIGTGNNVSGNNSGAFGDPSTVSGNESYVLGNNNTVSTDNTFVVGNNVTKTTAGSVVLGTGSAARTAEKVAGFVPAKASTADASAIAATTSTTGAVAVGDAENNIYRQITGVAAGTANSDAVNVAQLKTVDNKVDAGTASVANILGAGATVNGDGSISNPTYNVGGTTSNTLAGALGALDTAVQNAGGSAVKAKTSVSAGQNVTIDPTTNSDGSTNYQVSTAKDLVADSLTAGNTVVNNSGVQVGSNVSLTSNGLTIVNGPSVTTSGINAAGTQITGVAAGTASTDAVNKGQLDTAISGVASNVSNLTSNAVQYDKNADGSVNKDKITLGGGSNGTTITNVANGAVATGSKDAVNGGQLAGVSNSVANVVGGNATVNADGTVSTSNIGGTGKNTINDAIASVNSAATQAKSTVSSGNNVVVTSSKNTDGSTNYQVATADNLNVSSVKTDQLNVGSVSVGNTGINAGSQKVTNVASGTVAASSTDAVNAGQLYTANSNLASYLGGGSTVDSNGQVTAPSYSVAGSAYNNLGDALTAVDNRVGNVENNLNQAFTYTNNRINKLEDKLSAGIAASAALEQAPFVPGKWTYAAGASYYNNQGAVGATLRRTADNGRWSMTGGVAGGNTGSPLFRVGISGVID
ncbi:ESPR-type extended signal peptide-containing protein [Acinetobacter boissieri]|uniref:Head domain of trimeric autotransporter adhesin n=1 Tax=Acinetobacter boissieri TaxID=1219383 RepID=A0A1G6GMD2_9GAMM|nr:ESPR-type extended signal peptide-containing protein [Acinetobacter boissieri]SDB83181.1 Head domain of trimeric autotransporter adhesin [Acinetobacter boissieri]